MKRLCYLLCLFSFTVSMSACSNKGTIVSSSNTTNEETQTSSGKNYNSASSDIESTINDHGVISNSNNKTSGKSTYSNTNRMNTTNTF